jgi:hypothetical protein
MGYIRRYNESSNFDMEDLHNDVRDCFSEFIDSNSAEMEDLYYEGEITDAVYITVDVPSMQKYRESNNEKLIPEESESMDFLIKKYEESLNIFKDIDVAIKRVKDKYPNVIVSVVKEPEGLYKGEILSYLNISFREGI